MLSVRSTSRSLTTPVRKSRVLLWNQEAPRREHGRGHEAKAAVCRGEASAAARASAGATSRERQVFCRGASSPCLLAIGVCKKCLFCRSKAPRAYEKCCSGSARQAPGPQKCSKKQGKCTRIALRRNCSRFAAENAPYKNVGQFWLKKQFFFQIGKLNMKIAVLHRGTP